MAAQFDLDNPTFPPELAARSFPSAGYPYEKKLKWSKYEKHLLTLQIELTKLQAHLQDSGERVAVVFEGRDAAGKGGAIKAYGANLNPRHTRTIALTKPSDRERGQWYFQRYVQHLPTDGETVLFDRSWYNRAGVEPVMGFCTHEQHEDFLSEVPDFEKILVRDGIKLFKFWLNIGQEMQLKRFHDRRHSPLKSWKLSPIDLKALDKWDDYTHARDMMLYATHTKLAPWQVVRTNDKRRGRLAMLQHVLSQMDYVGKDEKAIGKIDAKILMDAEKFMKLDG